MAKSGLKFRWWQLLGVAILVLVVWYFMQSTKQKQVSPESIQFDKNANQMGSMLNINANLAHKKDPESIDSMPELLSMYEGLVEKHPGVTFHFVYAGQSGYSFDTMHPQGTGVVFHFHNKFRGVKK